MHQPLLQVRAFTGETRPLVSSQSQNQLPQSSVVLHATFVAPLGLLGAGGGEFELVDSVGSDSSVGVGADDRLEPLSVVGVLSGPPEQATTTSAKKRVEKGFMAARTCNAGATHDRRSFRGRGATCVGRQAPAWRLVRDHMLIGSGMKSRTNITSVRIAIAFRLPSSGSAPVDG